MFILEEQEIKLMKEQQKQNERQKDYFFQKCNNQKLFNRQRLDQQDSKRKLQYQIFFKNIKTKSLKNCQLNLQNSLINPLKQNIIKYCYKIYLFLQILWKLPYNMIIYHAFILMFQVYQLMKMIMLLILIKKLLLLKIQILQKEYEEIDREKREKQEKKKNERGKKTLGNRK
ncbi:unnamed protein product [Paramecium primaurelia]|uniref:Transmembrane protein n=1 Tax=Paramecium primaurelia TaxID=5886 RepID=A0A8S1LHD0_PARPR|nr:unnamed protein product [Paramecium primaurelia]